jgi:BirA family transcriptional regulator, biotin operon repressor / biotin---[acetyl-CoA-carboxylase] ligase
LKLPTGHRVLHFERVDSTNSEARRLSDGGERGPLWIWSDEQTSGRGRLGRKWVSEPGNLYVTCLFETAAPLGTAAQISFVAAVAVHELASGLLPKAGFSLKWPNDVLNGGAKFCGLLAEVVGTNPTRIALGCGINLAHAPKDTPYPVMALGAHFTPESVLEKLAVTLWSWLKIWDDGRGFPAIRSAWIERAAGVGGDVCVDGIQGRFEGVGADGALLMTLADGTQKSIHAGEARFAAIEKLRSGTQ